MTTAIYFFLMAITLFVLPQLVIRFIFAEPILDKRVRFLLYAATLPILWFMLVPKELNDMRIINFLQHTIGGGVAIGFISLYFISIFKEKIPLFNINSQNTSSINLRNFIFELTFVYFLVCGFGVANELLEFLLDAFKIGIFSSDRYDTWFDLLANTMGAFSVFFLHKILTLCYDRYIRK